MLSNFRNLTLRRVLVMLLGIVLLSIGVALFDFSRMGNDPSTSVVIALGDQTGLGLSRTMLLCNSVYFIVEILLARGMIGLGTFVNWTCIGPIAEVLLARMYRVPWLCEALSIILSRRQSKIPYFWCRIATDSICAIAAALLGGVIGIGTLICALGLGPFITFFDHLISRKLCGLPA